MTVTHNIGRASYPLNTDGIIKNVLPELITIDGNLKEVAFLTMFEMAGKREVSQEEFFWNVDEYLAFTDTTTGTALAAATLIPVSNGTYFNIGNIWKNARTGELFRIDGVSGNNVTAQRAVTASSGGTAAADMVSGDTLINLGAVVGENNTRQVTQITIPREISNFTAMFRTDLSMSNRQIKRRFYTGAELPRQEKKSLQEARKALARLLWDSEKGRFTTTDGQNATTTQGMFGVPTTNIMSVGGTLYEADLDEFLVNEGLRRGGNKVLLSSTAVILAINQIGKDRIRNNVINFKKPDGKSIGIEILEYLAPNGDILRIMEDRHLTEVHQGDAVGVDFEQVEKAIFSGQGKEGDLHLLPDTKNPDDVGSVSTLYADMGLWYGAEEHHFKITGVDGGAAVAQQV